MRKACLLLFCLALIGCASENTYCLPDEVETLLSEMNLYFTNGKMW